MEPGGLRDRDGGAAIPFILSAGMQVDIGLAAQHGHGFGAGGTHRYEGGVQAFGNGERLGGGARAAHQHAELA